MRIRAGIIAAAALAFAAGPVVSAQQNDLVSDADISVVTFRSLVYPAVALSARVEGAVVVSASLDEKGAVSAATALSGHNLLVPSALAAIRTWTFKPNAQRRVIVVFDFRVEGACHTPGNTLVRLTGPNVVRVVDCMVPNF